MHARLKTCIACGQTLPEDMPCGVHLRGLQLHLVQLVQRSGPNGFPTDTLFDRLYAHDPNGGPNYKTLHVMVAHVNKKLSAVGKRVRARYRGRGGPSHYVLEDIKSWSG